MNAVEIADAVAQLAEKPFDPVEFPFEFLAAFGNKETTITRLRKGDSNLSDIEGGVLQKNNIHLAVCDTGAVRETLRRLKVSPKTTSAKAKFVLATDGETLEAEDLKSGEPLTCEFVGLADHFGFFLPLAGISTITEIKDNPIDVRATGRLNKLYVEILRTNEDWQAEERRADLNHFFARLIFCFFAEDTRIFHGDGMFTDTLALMSNPDGSNVNFVLGWLFRAMNLSLDARKKVDLPLWADKFPYVNGGLFSDDLPMPRFTRTARSYLLRAGELNWREINPDIFGSMIQAVADDEERGSLGMHYTSVPNILKVLNPLFLDDLREQLGKAGDHKASLLKLRERMSRIRVFDPACGSGNFLVIAYKEMRKIEAEINRSRGEEGRPSDIPPTNFRGIEIRDFAAEIARLALVIAEYQCDVLHRGERLALAEFLPLNKENWVVKGNALRLDWTTVCPVRGASVKVQAHNLFGTPLDQTEIDFANEGGETFICGNPPFTGTRKQTDAQKRDLDVVFSGATPKWKNVDYVGAWLLRAGQYSRLTQTRFAFVATNSLCQGQQVPITWAILQKMGCRIRFAHTSFKWSNLAAHNAGVTVIIVGMDLDSEGDRAVYSEGQKRIVRHINPYLTEHEIEIITAERKPRFLPAQMDYGVYYSKSAGLMLDLSEKRELLKQGFPERLIRRFLGSTEFINGVERFCLWIGNEDLEQAISFETVRARIESVRQDRLDTDDVAVGKLAARPHQFRERKGDGPQKVFVPIVSSENREYFPVGLADEDTIPTNKAFFISEAPLWCMAILSSKLHLIWIATVCGRLEMRYSYSNTLGWNTFPMPKLTSVQQQELTKCGQEILLAREAHFPATIADLYDPKAMPDNLRRAHDLNDETLERIYIGRRFRNDTERLEKLFEMYSSMTAKEKTSARTAGAKS